MKTLKFTTLILLLGLLLSACSNKKAQNKKYYRLNAAVPSAQAEIKSMTLVVKRPSALSILGGRPMVATQEDGSLIQLSKNFWLESPKVLLQDHIKQWASQHWQDVTDRAPSVSPYQTLETRILAFEKNQQQARVSLEFFLYDHDNKLLFNQQFETTENLPEPGFKAFTVAISQAVTDTLNQLQQKL